MKILHYLAQVVHRCAQAIFLLCGTNLWGLPQVDQVNGRLINGFTVKEDVPFDSYTRNQLIHSVETPDERGFAGPGRPNDLCDFTLRNVKRHVLEGLKRAVVQVQILNLDLGISHNGLKHNLRSACP